MKKIYFSSAIALSFFMPMLAQASEGGYSDQATLYIAGIFGVALAAVGGTYAQSRAASVALEGIARNPAAADKLFTPMLLALALMESLVIFTLVSIFLVK